MEHALVRPLHPVMVPHEMKNIFHCSSSPLYLFPRNNSKSMAAGTSAQEMSPYPLPHWKTLASSSLFTCLKLLCPPFPHFHLFYFSGIALFFVSNNKSPAEYDRLPGHTPSPNVFFIWEGREGHSLLLILRGIFFYRL